MRVLLQCCAATKYMHIPLWHLLGLRVCVWGQVSLTEYDIQQLWRTVIAVVSYTSFLYRGEINFAFHPLELMLFLGGKDMTSIAYCGMSWQ